VRELVEQRFDQVQGELTDRASALQNIAFAIGSAIAPVIGGRFTDVYGFRTTADIFAGFALMCACLNFSVVFIP
jgi:predicted MFS family arabinose efflux permease